MVSVSTIKASNSKYAPSFRPVIVVFGGTSGIGSGLVRAFAHHVPPQTGAHIIIVGRSKQSADSIIASLPANANSKYDFVQVDAVVIRNLRTAIREQLFGTLGLTKINYLVLSQGAIDLDATKRTSEGIHPTVSLAVYGRIRAALDLAPLVQAAAALGEDARVMTVAKPAWGGPVDLDDINLEKKGLAYIRAAMITYTDIAVLELAKQFPELAFIHADPGFVKSGLTRGLPPWMRRLYGVMEWVAAMSADDSGERIMSMLVDPACSKGAFARDENNKPVKPVKWAEDEKTRNAVWKYLVERSNL
ncbi:hypothetical protein EXIGLDRAFT_745428 [Exidia glandulosa HHB12029]|uniref:NAD(P)-binding protein n=1 Tax=Exidia glandulosa HHB12029 TaxID=1314781 RepID=A0A165NJE5_EXIGL|nr:hypothetical protein EXIGLDRAFT_745428 [Exidia glandulosa HHB12029]